MQKYSIERLGFPNLDFTGELIGQSGNGIPLVRIYRTEAGKFIGEVQRGPQMSAAQHFDTPEQVVNWLKYEFNSITPLVQVAIEAASQNDDSFKHFWNEEVA